MTDMLVDCYRLRTDCDAADIVIEFAPEVPGFASRCAHGNLAQGRSPLVAIKSAVDACQMVNRYWRTMRGGSIELPEPIDAEAT